MNYVQGTTSRKLENECSRNMELMWLVNEIQPENKTICTFRKNNAKPLKEMFKSFCRMLKDWDMIDGKVVYNLKRLVNIFGIAPLIAKLQGKS